MRQISISEIQRNLHKLDDFDIVEIIDKKRNKVKGYYIDSKYLSLVKQLSKKIEEQKKVKSVAGSLNKYANSTLIEQENGAWEKAILKKYTK